MKFYDSPEVEKLKKLIADKKQYLNKLDNNKFAYQQTQKEIMFLENDILPLVFINSNLAHSEFVKYAVKCFDSALFQKCNGLLMYQPIDEHYIDRPIIGIVNPRTNQQFGTFGAMEIYIDNMDANGAKVKPINLLLS